VVKLLQIQFRAPNPKEVLPWMLQQGVGATRRLWGRSASGIIHCREGAVPIPVGQQPPRRHAGKPGHAALMSSTRRARCR